MNRKINAGFDFNLHSPGGIGIPYDIIGSDTSGDVAKKIAAAINKFYITVPDFRGKFIRIWNNGSSNDPDASILRGYRYGQGQIIGDVIGSFQLDEIDSHNHNVFATTNFGRDLGIDNSATNRNIQNNLTQPVGGSESRPINQYLNMFIKY